MASGGDLYGGKGMSPRKAMASGGGGDFGAGAYPGKGRKISPDHTAGTGERGAMGDGDRGIGMPVSHSKDHHPGQAAPDHGPGNMGMDFSRGGKV